jgi:hypothetical protein
VESDAGFGCAELVTGVRDSLEVAGVFGGSARCDVQREAARGSEEIEEDDEELVDVRVVVHGSPRQSG